LKAYILLDVSTKKVVVNRDVTVNEHIPYFTTTGTVSDFESCFPSNDSIKSCDVEAKKDYSSSVESHSREGIVT
ncbi:hypothetical protein KI387_025563, partial [Taxus chinensis]